MFWCTISGLITLYTGGRMYQTISRLKRVGKVIEADVFSIERPSFKFRIGPIPINSQIITTVCYQNERQEWIAGKLRGGLVELKKGDKVSIRYDPEDPTTLVFNDGTSNIFNAVLTILIGLALFGYGLYKYLE